MASATRPKYTDLIYDAISDTGTYRVAVRDRFFARGLSYDQFDKAVAWLVERRLILACGSMGTLLYVRPDRKVRYDNIRPAPAALGMLLKLHRQPLTLAETLIQTYGESDDRAK